MSTDRKPPFRFSHTVRVGFDETDAQGIVYYGRYMPYFDRARVEYLRHLACCTRRRADREFVMRANRVEYHAPARFDDLLEVFVRVERIGTSSVVFQFSACDDHGEELCSAEQVVVLIDVANRRPVTVPETYRNAVDLLEGRSTAAVPEEGPAGRRSGAIEAVERIIHRESEADEILRQSVATIAKRFETFCGIRFVEDGGMLDGPSARRLRRAAGRRADHLRRLEHRRDRARHAARGGRPRRVRPHREAALAVLPRRVGHRRRGLEPLRL